jgi:acetyltransferase-like isoleucine patch superfamily enzyme
VLSRVPKVRRAVIEAQTFALQRLHPGRFGPGLRVFGWPIVTVAPGSTLRCGRELVLISDPVYSEAGLNHPCVLRTLRPGASLLIGDEVGLNGATVCAASSVRIGSRVLVGGNVVIADTDFHALAIEGRRYSSATAAVAPVDIGDDVFLGFNVLVLKGVTIGAGAVVAAGSVVVGDVPAGAVVGGVPARVIAQTPRLET